MDMSDPFHEPAAASSGKEPLELNSLEGGWGPDQSGRCLEGISLLPCWEPAPYTYMLKPFFYAIF